jgi:hypothetical protein
MCSFLVGKDVTLAIDVMPASWRSHVYPTNPCSDPGEPDGDRDPPSRSTPRIIVAKALALRAVMYDDYISMHAPKAQCHLMALLLV